MAVATEAALEQTLFGAISLRSGRGDAEFQVLAAKVVSGRAAIDNAAHCIQVHGGMGYTDEHNAHLYLKRAHVLDHFFGSDRDALAAVLAAERHDGQDGRLRRHAHRAVPPRRAALPGG